jgi:hypothetical protein
VSTPIVMTELFVLEQPTRNPANKLMEMRRTNVPNKTFFTSAYPFGVLISSKYFDCCFWILVSTKGSLSCF